MLRHILILNPLGSLEKVLGWCHGLDVFGGGLSLRLQIFLCDYEPFVPMIGNTLQVFVPCTKFTMFHVKQFGNRATKLGFFSQPIFIVGLHGVLLSTGGWTLPTTPVKVPP